ncbi:acylphosphatase [Arthrobacter yangruifuii]|uniref:acylphosphatase n=1 Tax=Arthrobacter yangruifuii TaxID=2606616 RepID=A0A5N6MHF7_9MICC|nr:acylphosphatase [Arthrobacter yangruifuii]KAD3515308.1 acylphosphatase [Arthrobacter yangruifuii]
MNEQDYPEGTPRRLTARVTGEVQGVGFRYRTQRQAVQLGLTGVVSNAADGSVRVVAEGREPALDGLREFLRGPKAPGMVAAVEESFSAATGEFSDFSAE